MSQNQTAKRVTFQPSPEAGAAIASAMTRTGQTRTRVLSRAAVLYDFLSGLAGEGELVVSAPGLEDPVTIMFL